MDMRTGQRYDSAEAALAAGVPASDIAEVDRNGNLVRFLREAVKVHTNQRYPVPHQGARERARRLKRMAV